MPPKPKKPKVKKDKSVKAIAKTKKGSAQAQTTNVVVKVGETKKAPARRRRAPAKPKVPPPTPPRPDGWYPPQNLTRSGATFAGAEQIRYVNVPTPAQSSFIAGGATAPSTFVPPPETSAPPEMESGYDASFAPEEDSGVNITEFLRQAKEKPKAKERQIYDPFLPPEEVAKSRSTQTSFAPPAPELPVFAPPALEPPAFAQATEPDVVTKKNVTQAMLIRDIREAIKSLKDDGVIADNNASRVEFNELIFGEFGKKKSDLTAYNKQQLEKIRSNIQAEYGY